MRQAEALNIELNHHFEKADIEEQKENEIESRATEIAKDILSFNGYEHRGATYNASDVSAHIYENDHDGKIFDGALRLIASSPVIWNKPSNEAIRELMQKHAHEIALQIAEAELKEDPWFLVEQAS